MPRQGSHTSGTRQPRVVSLPYRAPPIVPALVPFVMMMLLSYLALSTHVTHDGADRVTPAYVHRLEEQPAMRWLGVGARLFEDALMRSLFKIGVACFASIRGIRVVAVAAWIAHVIETSIGVRLCREHGATLLTTLKYACGVFCVGWLQLRALRRACNRTASGAKHKA